MAEVDTSSYPRPTAPANPLDIAGKLGGLQSQAIQINQQKLDQAGQAVNYLTNAITAIGPNGTEDQYKRAGRDAARTYNIPENMVQTWDQKIDSYKDQSGKFNSSRFFDEALAHGASHQERFNQYRGQLDKTNTGANTIINRIPGSPNVAPSRLGVIPNQLPLTQPTIERGDITSPNYGGPTTIGNQRPPQTPGFTNRLRPFSNEPIAPANVPGMRKDEQATSVEMPATNGAVPTGLSPNYQEGAKRYFEDSNLATGKLQAIKPAMQALPLMEELTTGIGTDRFNQVLAGLHNLGILPSNVTDKVTAYQIITKKLADYVRTNPVGQRSDAAQALSEAASPNPKAQINPALIKLTKDAIALDLGQAVRAPAFSTTKNDAKGKPVLDETGNPANYSRKDYENYIQHSATFPAKIDERAIGIHFMKPDDAKKLLNTMSEKANTSEGKKFKYTIDLMKKLDLL